MSLLSGEFILVPSPAAKITAFTFFIPFPLLITCQDQGRLNNLPKVAMWQRMWEDEVNSGLDSGVGISAREFDVEDFFVKMLIMRGEKFGVFELTK